MSFKASHQGFLALTILFAASAGISPAQTFGGSNPITVSSTLHQSVGSSVSVSGLSGTVTAISLNVSNLNATNLDSLAFVLVPPASAGKPALDVISGVCHMPNSSFTLADSGATGTDNVNGMIPAFTGAACTISGTYFSSDHFPGQDVFNSPGPSSYNSGGNGNGAGTATFLGTFGSVASSMNGTWTLYAANQDTTGNFPPSGSLGAWSLTFTLAAGTPTTTTLNPGSPNPAFTSVNGTATSVSFTATVAPNPGGGTVTFFDGTTPIASNVGVNGSGSATANVTFSQQGPRSITAQFNGTSGFGQSPLSNAVIENTIDHASTPTTNADGSTQICNPGPITLKSNAGGTPYPLSIVLGGTEPTLGGVIQKLSVTLNNVAVADPDHLGFALQAPSQSSAFQFLSWANGNSPVNTTLTLSDTGSAAVPIGTVSGSTPVTCPSVTNACLPTDNFNQVDPSANSDSFPSPAPQGSNINSAAPTGTSTFANQFGGFGVNGTWNLYVTDRKSDGTSPGTIGSFCLNFTMQTNAHPTHTALSGVSTPIQTGGNATITATVSVTDTSGLTPNAGTVTFVDGTTSLGSANVVAGVATLNIVNGKSALNNVVLVEGSHHIIGSYSGTTTTPEFGVSNGTLNIRVDNPIAQSGVQPYTYCNAGSVAIPGMGADSGAAAPYPTNILVSGLPGTVRALTVTLNGFTTNDENDLLSLLVGPGGNNIDFFSLSGLSNCVNGSTPCHDTFGPVNVTFDDTAAVNLINRDATGGSFKPTSENTSLTYPACPPNVPDCNTSSPTVGPPLASSPFTPANKAAPAGTAIFGNATAAGVFGGTTFSTYNGNGEWSLYLDDGPVGAGRNSSITGWCVNLTQNLPDISLTDVPMTHSPSIFKRGQAASFTITAKNNGPGSTGLPTLTITDTLPAGLTFTGSSGAGWSCSAAAQVVTCTQVNPIAAGNSSAVTINVSVANTTADSISNSATSDTASFPNGTGGDGTPGNNVTSNNNISVAGTILTINKTHTDPFTQGQTGATYNITVTNTGTDGTSTPGHTGATVGTVQVTDSLPTNFTVTNVTGTGWTCQPVPAIMCTLNASLAVGSTTSPVVVTVNVSNSMTGPVTNTAILTATTDQIGTNNTHDDPTNITQVPTQLIINPASTGQSTTVNTAFATALSATIEDAGNHPVPNISVTFTPPGTGASGTFAVVNAGGQTCTASSCVVTTNSSGVATASTFTANGTIGTYNVAAAANALSGNFSLTNTDTPAVVTGVSSTAANGSYTVGAVIPITVTFNKTVVVTGTPTLTLNDGAVVNYTSGSGSATLTFSYTVAAGQNASPLDEASTTALALAGGATIKNLSTLNANLTLPAPGGAGALGVNKTIIVDTTAPTVTNVSSTTANGTYGPGATIAITVTFSEAVNVAGGTPLLALNSGGTASYTSGSGTNTLIFTYTVAAGQNSPHLDYTSTTALSLNGATIKDNATNAAVLTLPAPGGANSLGGNKSIVIDTTAPTVTSVSSTAANGTYGIGAIIPITVTFSKVVNVTGGTPLLALNSGGTASYVSGTGSNTLTFNYTVLAGQSSAHLDYTSTGALTANGATIQDAVLNNANLTLPAPGAAGSLSANKNIVIDTSAPAVTSVSSTTANGTYGVGAVIAVTVSFNKTVNVTGTPLLALNSGGTANYTSGSGTSTLTFTYTVAAGQNASPLDEASTTALTLNGGTIQDVALNNANLTLPAPGSAGSLGVNKTIVIDTGAPTVTNVSSTTANGTYGTGAVITITVTFNKTVNVTGTPQLALNSGGTANYTSGSGSNTLSFTYTVAAGQNSSHLDYASTSALTLNGGTIQDAVLNNANLTLPAPGAAGSLGANKSIVISTVGPTVVSYSVLFGTQSYNVIGSSRVRLPWQITGIRVVFSTPIAAGDLNSLTGVTSTAFTGLGTNTLTWTINPVALGNLATLLQGSGVDALKDAEGNALGNGAGFPEALKVLWGDVNDDGVVNSSDLALVLLARGQAYNVFDDLNGDGVVDINDANTLRPLIGTSLP